MSERKENFRKRGWKERAKEVRLLLLDVDGVLTDGRLTFDPAGREIKSFHIRDGQGIKLLQTAGIQVGILTGRKSKAVESRARELGIHIVLQNVQDKCHALKDILKRENLSAEQVGYVGDDLIDVPVLSSVGFALAVADAVPEVKMVAHYTTKLRGGEGAVREISENILKAQGKWQTSIRIFIPPDDCPE